MSYLHTKILRMSQLGPWMTETLRNQLSGERDFEGQHATTKTYAILCTHRSGSNLLSEGLYTTGWAGDPMEFWNIRFMKLYREAFGVDTSDFATYLAQLKERRTSPNGVFGFNIKADQFRLYFKDDIERGRQFLQSCDHVILHTRKDKIKQAISSFMARQMDLFRIPKGVPKEEISKLTKDIPFDPAIIAQRLFIICKSEKFLKNLLRELGISYTETTYEGLTADYHGTLTSILQTLGIDIPEGLKISPVTQKIANEKNRELEQKMYQHISGNPAFTL